jgi:hypothetical protein
MYTNKIFCKFEAFFILQNRIYPLSPFVKKKMRRLLPPLMGSSLPEGLAVGALVHGRIGFVGAYQDAVQGAVVLGVAVISTGLNGAFDALIGMMIHRFLPPSCLMQD